jgi:L-iditol 2-dehydrogenase
MTVYEADAWMYLGRPGAMERQTLEITCGPTDLVLEIRICARCGTDKTIYREGHPRVDPYAPVVLGHELVGRIVQVGSEVSSFADGIGYCEGKTLPPAYLSFQVGERVVCQSRIARYRDGLMLIPRPIANLSSDMHGGFSQYMRVPESMIRSGSVLRVPNGVSDEAACLVEPTACALESIFASPHQVGVDEEGRHIFRGGVEPGGSVCVIGSGAVGMIYARLALLEGAGRVVMVVRSEAKRDLVNQTLGGEVEIYLAPRTSEDAAPETLAAEDRIVEDLSDLTGGYLFDDVISACASPAAQRLMLRLYTPEGYAVGACFGGTHRLVDAAHIDLNHYRAAKTMGSSGCSTACMETILKWLEEGRLDLEGFLSRRRFTLEDDPHEFFTTAADGLKPALFLGEFG